MEAFGDFVDATSFSEINGRLQDAYLYYHLLKNDEFDFSEDNLKAVLSFGSTYCSESDNSDVGSKLLVKYQESGWTLEAELLALFWGFVCKYSSFMIFTLYELFTETIYQHASEASEPCTKLDSLIRSIKSKTPQQYREYLSYLNSPNSVEHLLLYLSGHSNPFTNSFYITWLLQSYTFNGGMSNGQPISKVLQALLKNITKINGCEKQMIEILLATSDNQALFENILSVFMTALREPSQLEQLCVKYVEVTESLTDRQLNRFEQLLLETPGAAPIATRLCARKIASAKNPENEFWRFYDNQRSRILANSGFAIEPMILACINNVDAKIREDVAIDILRKINASVINDGETIMVLTMLINLEKMFGLKDKDTLKRNLAVVINKVDIPTLEEKIGETAAQQYLAENAKTCKSYMDARDAVCRNFLEEYGAGNFVRTAEAKFKTVRYFTCSALGHNHEGQPYEGKNVVDPVMWLLQQADSSIKAE